MCIDPDSLVIADGADNVAVDVPSPVNTPAVIQPVTESIDAENSPADKSVDALSNVNSVAPS